MDTTTVPGVDLRRKNLLKPTDIAIQSNSSREVTLMLTGPTIEAVTGSYGCGKQRMSVIRKILLEFQITATNTTNGTETITHKYSFNESRVNFSYL